MGNKLQNMEIIKLHSNPNQYSYQNSGIDVKSGEQRQLQALRDCHTDSFVTSPVLRLL